MKDGFYFLLLIEHGDSVANAARRTLQDKPLCCKRRNCTAEDYIRDVLEPG